MNIKEQYKRLQLKKEAKLFIDANVWDGDDRSGCKNDYASFDPDNLQDSSGATMNFGEGESDKTKKWKDIWGSGQGIGTIKDVVAAADRISDLKVQYEAAKDYLKSAYG